MNSLQFVGFIHGVYNEEHTGEWSVASLKLTALRDPGII